MATQLVICNQCDTKFDKKISEIKRTKNNFCVYICHHEWMKEHSPNWKYCLNCNERTKNPKFCNKSCAAIYNNKAFPKRPKKQRCCKRCNIEIFHRGRYCDDCRYPYSHLRLPTKIRSYKDTRTYRANSVDWSKVTIADVRALNLKRPYTRITGHARRVYFASGRPEQCIACDYDKHFNICHIKPIHTFDDDTPISAVNDLDNLIALCPNHHWELDNGFLNVKDLINQ